MERRRVMKSRGWRTRKEDEKMLISYDGLISSAAFGVYGSLQFHLHNYTNT